MAKGLPKSKDILPAVSRNHLWQLVGPFSVRGEFAPLAVISWIFPLRVRSKGVPMRRRELNEGMSGPHSFLCVVRGRMTLRLKRRKHGATGAILTRFCRREAYDTEGEDPPILQLLCPV